MLLNENLFEAKGFIGTQKGEKRGPYKTKKKDASKLDYNTIYDALTNKGYTVYAGRPGLTLSRFKEENLNAAKQFLDDLGIDYEVEYKGYPKKYFLNFDLPKAALKEPEDVLMAEAVNPMDPRYFSEYNEIRFIKNFLSNLITDNGIRALRDDEKLPRGFRFKSGSGHSGEVTYKGKDYAYALVNGKVRVMPSSEAGWNWSETIYKMDEDVETKEIHLTDAQKQFVLDDLFEDEDLHNFYQAKLNTDWVITSNKELDPIRNPSDDAQFPYVLIVDGEFTDALGKDYINKVKDVNITEDVYSTAGVNNSEMSFDIKDDGTIVIYDNDKEIKRSKTNPEYAKQVLKDLGFKVKDDEIIKEDTDNSDFKSFIDKFIDIHKDAIEKEKERIALLKNPIGNLNINIEEEIKDSEERIKQHELEILNFENIKNTRPIKESFEDEHLGSTEKVIEDGGEIIPDSVNPGPDAGIASQLNKLIRDEWEAIQGYNDAIVMAELEGFHDVAKVFKDIVNEENVHVGQLEQCMKLVSPNTDSIVHGEIEAEGQLGEESAPIEKEEDPEEGMHY